MDVQLRIYRVRPGKLDAFVRAWRRHALPLRAEFGFRVLGAWHAADGSEFVWQLAYDGPEGLEQREREYAAARGKVQFEDDPAAYLDGVEVRFLRGLREPVATA